MSSLGARLSTWNLGVAGGGLFLLSLVLFARSAGGGFQRPIESGVFVTTAMILASVSASLRLSWLRNVRFRLSHWSDVLLMCLPSVASAIIGFSVMLPGSAAIALTVFWLVLLAGETIVWGPVMYRRRFWRWEPEPEGLGRTVAEEPNLRTDPLAAPDGAEPTGSSSRIDGDQHPPEHVSQQLIRLRDTSGQDAVRALLRGTFAPGQRALSLHVAFCPPLESTPHVQTRQLDGAATRIKVAQVLPYGARLDLRLERFSEEAETVLIKVLAGARETDVDSDTTRQPASGGRP